MTEPKPPQPNEGPAAAPPDATLQMSAGAPTDPGRTVRMEAPPVLEPPVAASARAGSGSRRLWLIGGAVVLAGLGLAAYLFLPGEAPARTAAVPAPASESVPPGVQVYLDQARAGDAHAMRMLGVMYYYGLNVPQNREKGIEWYRRAAEKGSDAAREDLAKLQQTGAAK